MEHKISRRTALAAAGALVVSLTAACGSDDDSSKKSEDLSGNKVGAMDKYGAGDQFKATEALKFTILYSNHPSYQIKNDWLFWSELTKRTGVTLEPTVIPMSDYEQKRSLMIGAGDAPMIIPKTYPPQETPFVASGAILAVSDYLDLMPNFKDKIDKWKLEGDLDTLRAGGRQVLRAARAARGGVAGLLARGTHRHPQTAQSADPRAPGTSCTPSSRR